MKSADILKHFKALCGTKSKPKTLRQKCLDEYKGLRLLHTLFDDAERNALGKLRVQRQATTLRCLLCETFFNSPFDIETLFGGEKVDEKENFYSRFFIQNVQISFSANPNVEKDAQRRDCLVDCK